MTTFSVLIPCYNAAATIAATLDSVLAQTHAPHEVLVYDDGSTDASAEIVGRYGPPVRLLGGPNRGVAHARNQLCAAARGAQVAFLDADDLWHPRYLAAQARLIAEFPAAIATFTGHLDVPGMAAFAWPEDDPEIAGELIDPVGFLARYNREPMEFGMSWFSLRTEALRHLGDRPFYDGGAEDAYLHNLLPLVGSVARCAAPLATYRILDGSLSSDRLWSSGKVIDAFTLLARRYADEAAPRSLRRALRAVTASRKRDYGKHLMGAGRAAEARAVFAGSIRDSARADSVVKSMTLLGLTVAPRPLQPTWPQVARLQD
jgi:glycosyltransferase involved in cell wall biosynthesis